MSEIRGDIKSVNRGLLQPVDLLGCEKYYSLALLFFLITSNVLLAFSWFQLITIVVYVFGLIIGRAIYKKDPYFFKVFFSNFSFEIDESKQYLLPQSSVEKPLKQIPQSVRL